MRGMLCLTIALVGTGAWAAEVYRSVAADGTLIYSDRPSGANSVPITIATVTPRPMPAPAARPNAGSSTETAAIAAEPTAAEKAEERSRNCATARERAERYQASHRLYRTLPNGEREYLNDAEIDAARARAQADVETWCS